MNKTLIELPILFLFMVISVIPTLIIVYFRGDDECNHLGMFGFLIIKIIRDIHKNKNSAKLKG